MKIKTGPSLIFLTLMSISCGPKQESSGTSSSAATTAAISVEGASYDPKRGEGKFNESNVTLGSLNDELAMKGEKISGTKCFSCHKITDEKLVGPGWKGVTTRNTPHWILNFITNPDPMISKDPKLQAQLELCLVRMPNQNLADEEARQILEFMRKNDEKK